MKVPFVDLKLQYNSIKSEVREAMDEVLDNTAYILGKSVANFEKAFADKHDVKFCSGVSSGTDGNHLVLWALGVGPGDEVIIPGDTFIATAWGATLCGATPVFVDVDPESYNLDAAAVARAITPKTKAIVAVHLYGQATDMEEINYQLSIINFELLRSSDKVMKKGSDDPRQKHAGMTHATGVFRHKTSGQVIYLVEDCAQSHLAEYKGKKVGGLAAAASFSFYPGKNLGAYGEGGAVCTNDEELAKKFKMMREHGSHEKYLHLMYGHNYRMEGLQGAVLGVKLNHLEKWTAGRRQAAEWYRKYLGDCDGVVLPKEMPDNKHVYHLFVIRVKGFTTENTESTEQKDLSREKHETHEKELKEKGPQITQIKTDYTKQDLSLGKEIKSSDEVMKKGSDDVMKRGRDGLMKYLGERGVASGLHYPVPLHLQPCFEHLGYKRGDLPVTENLADNCLSLPMFPELTEEQVAFVCVSIKEYFI